MHLVTKTPTKHVALKFEITWVEVLAATYTMLKDNMVETAMKEKTPMPEFMREVYTKTGPSFISGASVAAHIKEWFENLGLSWKDHHPLFSRTIAKNDIVKRDDLMLAFEIATRKFPIYFKGVDWDKDVIERMNCEDVE